MKCVMLSIRPQWCEKIASGEKTIEVRKSAPKETPFKCYIYCCKDNAQEIVLLKDYKNRFSFGDYRNADGHFYDVANGTVIGEFICNKVERFMVGSLRSDDIEKLACLSYNEMISYFYKPEELDGETTKQGFAWHISDLKIYDKPKELSEFKKPYRWFNNRPVESWCDNCCKICDEKNCKYDTRITRLPQSWMFVEEI